MPTTMALWKVQGDGTAVPVSTERLSAEAIIESAVESAPELLGVDALIIGRQVPTPSGPLDLLALDSDRHLVVIENKRDRTPRDVLAQAIDYAAFVATLTLDEVTEIYSNYRGVAVDGQVDLLEDFEQRFGEELDALAEVPKMLIVASRLDDATERMVRFLADQFGVPVNAALFQPFEGGLIGRTWLRDEVQARPTARTRARSVSRDDSKDFWDRWLPIGRQVLPDIRLPANGPRSVLIKRRIISGHPSALTVWVSSAEAYAELQFDDDEPTMNEALLAALKIHRDEIERAFGGELEWRTLEVDGLMTRRTKVTTPRIPIGSRTEPDEAGLRALADAARRLVDAVRPHLSDALERATETLADSDTEAESPETEGLDRISQEADPPIEVQR